jgi:phycocyanobilin:ferredoxin oxidoreductase
VGDRLPERIRLDLEGRPSPPFSQRRELPPWGVIFSPHVLFVRPASPQEEDWFLDRVEDFLAVLATAVGDAAAQPWDGEATFRRREGQHRYCKQQKQNDKTRRVLEKAFSREWAHRYIEQLLFDDPPAPSVSG